MSVSTLVMHVIVVGSLCGLASWIWITVLTVRDYVRQRRIRHAHAIERRVIDAYRIAAAVKPSRERPALFRAHVEALTDRELMALRSIGSLLFRKASDARRLALSKGTRRASV